MNVEIANRLQQLRKNNNLSQEELAEKIGVSRQAVSKWERAEASPDTDNLILLSRLYNMSLDEILRTDSRPVGGRVSLKKDDYKEPAREMRPDNYTEEEIYPNRETVHNSIPQGSPFGADVDEEEKSKSAPNMDFGELGDAVDRAGRAIGDIINSAGQKINEEIKKTGKDGKTFEDKLENGINRLGRGIERAGMAVEKSFDKLGQKLEEKEKKYNNNYNYSYDHSSSSEKKKKHNHRHNTQRPPATLFDKLLPFIIVSLFFVSCGLGIPHWGWVLFLLIPLYYTTKEALRRRSLNMFCYPLLCAVIYFGIGMPLLDIWSGAGDLWMSTMWLLFLTIPLYYTGIAAIKKRNPLIFCYPVLCVIVYLFFGILLDGMSGWAGGWWFSVAWAPLAMSIPVYYIVIDHYRKKNKASKGMQSTVSSVVD